MESEQNHACRPPDGITMLPPSDVQDTLGSIGHGEAAAVILDPWYNRGTGGIRNGYDSWLADIVGMSLEVAGHVFVWGFPDIVCRVIDRLPGNASLTAWLTWYYKNCPSVTRGWRQAQQTYLHISRNGSKSYPENFMTAEQREKYAANKIRFVPGPPTVLEVPLNIGFVGKAEQTGYPAQKPVKTIEPLILMSSRKGDLIVDPMCGSGTTGVACINLDRRAILCDESHESLDIVKKRLAA